MPLHDEIVAKNRVKTIFYNSKCRRDKFLFTFNGKKSMRSVAIEHVYNGSNCILMDFRKFNVSEAF